MVLSKDSKLMVCNSPLTCKTYGIVWHHLELKILIHICLSQEYGVLSSLNISAKKCWPPLIESGEISFKYKN